MPQLPEPPAQSPHYLIDAAASPDDAWRFVAAHHLLTSRHLPLATMSISGISDSVARPIRIYATELGLSGLRIPDIDPPAKSVIIELPDPVPPPSVICEFVALSLAASETRR